MNTNSKLFIFIISCCLADGLPAQILCIDCFRQNAPVSTNVTNYISNGSFENSNCSGSPLQSFCPASYNYSCDIQSWICTGGGHNTYAHLSGTTFSTVADGLFACYLGDYYCHICILIDDDTSCQLNQGCVVSGIPAGYPRNDSTYGGRAGVSVSQPVSGLIPGNIYVLEFWAGGEDGGGLFVNDGLFAFDLGFGNIFLPSKTTESNTGTGIRYVVQFVADAGTDTVKFTNWGHKCATCNEIILDDVRIYPVSQLSSIVPACVMSNNTGELSESIHAFYNRTVCKIMITSGKSDSRYILYNMMSQKIREGEFSASVGVDVSGLSQEMYIIEVYAGSNKIYQNKLIIN